MPNGPVATRFRPYDKMAPRRTAMGAAGHGGGLALPAVAATDVIDLPLPDGARFVVRFGDIMSQTEEAAAAVVVPAYAGGKMLAAAVGMFPDLCPAFCLAADAPEAKAVWVPQSTTTPVVVFTRYTRRTGGAYVTAHWAAIARAVAACACPPAGAGPGCEDNNTGPRPLTVLRVPAYGVQNGVTFSEAARYLLYGAVAFLQDTDMRGPFRRVELVLGLHGERVFAHIKNLIEKCGAPPREACVVCATFPRNVVSEPCGHWAVCSSCAHLSAAGAGAGPERCLVCRQHVTSAHELLSVSADSTTAVWVPCGHAYAYACPPDPEEGTKTPRCPTCGTGGKCVSPFFPTS